jgi:hypothetical protein
MKGFQGIWLIKDTRGLRVGLSLGKMQKRYCHLKHCHENLITSTIVFVITDVTGADGNQSCKAILKG